MQLLTRILQASSLVPALPQNATNGASNLGTVQAPTLPLFLTNNPLPDGTPFGLNATGQNFTAASTNPYEDDVPTTNVTRHYDFTLTRGIKAPDGFNKSMLLVNGQFPGPTLEANWGDIFSVTVKNRITGPTEGTSLHWHGLLQRNTSWYDGVPSVGQCPIAPGSDFTYTFRAGLYGTSWYHSHYSAQYADGLFGPMIIHGPNLTQNANYDVDLGVYDIDLGPVVLTDWYHNTSESIVESQESNDPVPLGIPVPDNNLINGKMIFDCPPDTIGINCTPNAGISTFNFTSGKIHRLRLINAGAEALQRFTIDDHEMTIIANDFVPVQPYKTNVVTLGAGQRTDILVTANGQPTDAVYMRSNISARCTGGSQPLALAAIFYEAANRTAAPNSLPTDYDDSICGNDPLEKTVPLFPYGPSRPAATTQTIDITFHNNGTNAAHTNGSLQWFMNNSTFHANYNHPILREADMGNISYPFSPEWNVYNFGQSPSVRVVLYNHVNAIHASHPMHLHGHNFFIIDEGHGTYDSTSMTNLTNPPRRDTHIMQQAIDADTPWYTVIQYDTDNPGVWPLHCHRAWHVSSGLYVNLMEHPDKIPNPHFREVMPQTCNNWDAYSNNHVVDEIDSGL